MRKISREVFLMKCLPKRKLDILLKWRISFEHYNWYLPFFCPHTTRDTDSSRLYLWLMPFFYNNNTKSVLFYFQNKISLFLFLFLKNSSQIKSETKIKSYENNDWEIAKKKERDTQMRLDRSWDFELWTNKTND